MPKTVTEKPTEASEPEKNGPEKEHPAREASNDSGGSEEEDGVVSLNAIDPKV